MTECKEPGHNRLTWCVEPEGHEGCHTYSPAPDPGTLPSDELEWVKTLLFQSCPDWVAGDAVTSRPKHCAFHHGAHVLGCVQKILRGMHL